MNKRGQGGLSTDTIIIAIIAIIVLLLVVTFFTGGVSTVFGKIRDVFIGGTAGYDVDLAKSNCQDYCQRAVTLKQGSESTYCEKTFSIGEGTSKKEVHCYSREISVTCSVQCTG